VSRQARWNGSAKKTSNFVIRDIVMAGVMNGMPFHKSGSATANGIIRMGLPSTPTAPRSAATTSWSAQSVQILSRRAGRYPALW
jgi:hypothetical protein